MKAFRVVLVLCLFGAWLLGASPLRATRVAASETAQLETIEGDKTPTNEIHVSTTGSNATGNGSFANPYATLPHAAQFASPGTAIRIHPGTYNLSSTPFLYDLHGTANAPIWVGGLPGEARPILQGSQEGLHLIRARYVIVHDLIVRNTTANGINADDGGDTANPNASHHILFRDLHIYNVGDGGNQDCLKLSGIYHFMVLDSEFNDCGGNNSGSRVDMVGCHYGLIVSNEFHDLSGNAIQIKGGSSFITVRGNRMVNSGQRSINIGGSTGLEFFRPPVSTTTPNAEARNISVIANIFEGSVTPFAFVGAVNSIAAHNVIINPTNWLMRILQETVSQGGYTFLPSGNNTVANNIFYFDRSALSSTMINVGGNTAPSTFNFSHNLWFAHTGTATYPATGIPVAETAPLYGQDPLFVNAGAGNYQLQAGSPAIGYGNRLIQAPFDYNGAAYNSPATLGAFEANPLIFSQFMFLPILLR